MSAALAAIEPRQARSLRMEFHVRQAISNISINKSSDGPFARVYQARFLLWGLPSILRMASQEPYPSPPPTPAKAPKVDPVLRNALRYTISAKEYETLHAYLILRSPRVVRKRALPPPRYFAIVESSSGDYNAAAVRASLRVFVATQSGLKLWDLIKSALLGRRNVVK